MSNYRHKKKNQTINNTEESGENVNDENKS
jgi:hypothetical protein